MATMIPEPTAPPPLQRASSLLTAVHTSRALSDPPRRAILQHLALGERKVVDLTPDIALADDARSRPRAARP